MNPVFGLAVWRSFVYTGRGVEFFACLAQASDILHLETKVVEPRLQLRSFDIALRLDGYDCQIDMTVRQIRRRADSVDNLQTEGRGIKLNQFLHVFCENCEVPDACHIFSPLSVLSVTSYEISSLADKRLELSAPQPCKS